MTEQPNPNILVLDDDEIILVALRETISAEGYNVTTVNNPPEALELLKNNTFGVIISDQRMAEMTGLEFFEKVKKIQPDATRILITGVLKLKVIIDAVNKGEIFRFIAKPWIREELVATVKNAVQRYQLIKTNQKLHQDTLALNESLTESNNALQQKICELVEKKALLDKSKKALEKNFQHSLELCFQIISSFHPILGEQTKATMDICKLLCESGAFTQEEQHVLTVSAALHNIGLIGVSRDLLSRATRSPASLEPSERALVNHHPCYGQTLASFVDELKSVGETIRAHHERWDGSGYPDGLAAEAIPKMASYLAIVVHYVESPLTKEAVIEEIMKLSGEAFSPSAVRLFLKVTRLVQLPKRVKEILFSELREGMALARGIYSPTGLLLIPEGHMLNSRTLVKIKEHNDVYPITQQLLIYV